MNILCIGDVIGSGGLACLVKHLPSLKKTKGIDVVIVNGENSSDSNGITPDSANALFSAGIDVITTGNHVWRRREIYSYLDENEFIIRPANYPKTSPGKGFCVLDFGSFQLAVINLLGTVYTESLACPFETADNILAELPTKNIIVDFHAETTSEKRALAEYLDGRITALFGTHTHVQTADEQILKKGTGFITDLGMTGPSDSVLGVKTDIIIERLKNKMPGRFELADGECQINGIIFEISPKDGKTARVERVNIRD